ncbi:MAG TPA: ABC transporter permease subunit, partial [Verrucomicrobiae bacterium]
MTAPNHNRRKFKNTFMQMLTFVCALLVVLPLVLVFYYLVKSGIGAVNWNFFTQLPKPVGELGGGMGNAIVGTFILLAQAACIGVPVGVLGGVYLSEYGSSRLNWWIRFAADILNGVPSITWGIVVYALMVVPLTAPFRGTVASVDAAKHLVTLQSPTGATQEFMVDANTSLNLSGKPQLDVLPQEADVMVWYHRVSDGTLMADSISSSGLWVRFIAKIIQWHNSVSGFSALAGGLVLGLMMIPLVMRTTEEVLQLVPGGYREASLALGISKWRTSVQIIIRTALKGIVTGVLLALARVAGETAPLLFTA